MDIVCKYCNSENVYFSKKNNYYRCEDCDQTFTLDKEIKPQRIFLSYGHDENTVLVMELKKLLEKRSHLPWIDKNEIKGGNEWRVKITEGIKNSQYFLAFVSEYSTRKPGVCLDEIAICLGTKKCPIQTIVLEKNLTLPSSISNKQWIDLSEWKSYYNQGGQIWQNWIEKQAESIFEIVENENVQKSASDITLIESKLKPTSFDIKLKRYLNEDLIGREWLINKVLDWQINDKKSRLFFIVGGAGVGKSAFATILSHYLYTCVATYFFEWNNAETSNIQKFIVNIIFQLACNISDYRANLLKICDSYHENRFSDYELLEKFLLIPLSELIDGNREPCIIVLDALDELKPETQDEFIKLIKYAVSNTPTFIKWVVTSRPETRIINALGEYMPYVLDVNKEKINEDIKQFLSLRFNDEKLIELLVNKCEGSFLYAREIVNMLGNKPLTLENINMLPNGVTEMYNESFKRIFSSIEDYTKNYKNILSLCVFAREPLPLHVATKIAGENDESLQRKLQKLTTFLSVEQIDGEKSIIVIHKTFIDWITSSSANQYNITAENAHKLFADYLINNLSNALSKYFTKHGYAHLKLSTVWNELTPIDKERVLKQLISSAKKFGELRIEKELIDTFGEYLLDDVDYTWYLLDYSIRSSGSTDRAPADKLLKYSEEEKEPLKRYKMREAVAVAYFYLGLDNLAFNLLLNERNSYGEEFWKDEALLASYNHALSLTAHDMDYNEMVKTASEVSISLYAKTNKTYDYLVSLVNNFDAYMGLGDFYSADKVAAVALKLNDEKYFIHVDDILKICYANLLTQENRLIEAFDYYEKGLKIASNIQTWDYIYGSIWREFAVAKFYDLSCLSRLLSLKQEAKRECYEFLESLAACFYLCASHILNVYDKNNIKNCIEIIELRGMHGHILISNVFQVLHSYAKNKNKQNEIIALMEKCQGVKGYPEIVNEYIERYKNEFLDENLKSALKWQDKHIIPILKYQKEYYENLTADLPDAPYNCNWSCKKCQAKCCYDGVYLNETEVNAIKQFVDTYPEYFTDLPQEFIVDGTWPGMEDTKKTATKPFIYDGPDYPKHFTNTRCVFADENGLCKLQTVATEKQLHPWKVKPRACWSFPIRGIRKNKIIPPPSIGEPDVDNIGPEYPGYVSFLPCGKPRQKGSSWKSILKNEIQYYKYKFNDKK